MKAILKYPGSKWRIAEWIISYMPEHRSYLEPYFGSGAVFFNKPESPIETINDLDGDVVNLFSCIREDSKRLATLVAATPYARQEYNSVFDNSPSNDKYEKARRFLVRCWMAAGVRTGVKTGWKNDVQGREAAYALRNWFRLPEWILNCMDRLKHVQIECMPAVKLIKRFNDPKVLVYADPPYLSSTRMSKQYRYEMSDAEHIELLETLLEHKGKVILSGYDNDIYNDYLKGWTKAKIKANAQGGGKRTEILWMNFDIRKQMSLF